MASGDVETWFVDTNVLVYANMAQAPLHAVALMRLQEVARTGAPLWVSRQVLREYLAVVTRPQRWSAPQPLTRALARVRYFQRRFQVADETAVVTARLLTLLRTIPAGGAQIHDANIVATMQAYGIQRLLTENVADFARFSGVITLVPLVVQDSSPPAPRHNRGTSAFKSRGEVRISYLVPASQRREAHPPGRPQPQRRPVLRLGAFRGDGALIRLRLLTSPPAAGAR